MKAAHSDIATYPPSKDREGQTAPKKGKVPERSGAPVALICGSRFTSALLRPRSFSSCFTRGIVVDLPSYPLPQPCIGIGSYPLLPLLSNSAVSVSSLKCLIGVSLFPERFLPGEVRNRNPGGRELQR